MRKIDAQGPAIGDAAAVRADPAAVSRPDLLHRLPHAQFRRLPAIGKSLLHAPLSKKRAASLSGGPWTIASARIWDEVRQQERPARRGEATSPPADIGFRRDAAIPCRACLRARS